MTYVEILNALKRCASFPLKGWRPRPTAFPWRRASRPLALQLDPELPPYLMLPEVYALFMLQS